MNAVQRACAVVFWSSAAVVAMLVLGAWAYGGWMVGSGFGWSVVGIALAVFVWVAELAVVAAVVDTGAEEIAARRTAERTAEADARKRIVDRLSRIGETP